MNPCFFTKVKRKVTNGRSYKDLRNHGRKTDSFPNQLIIDEFPSLTSAPPIIELEQISKSYQGIPALQDVSLRVPSGVVGLLGPNGSGKSTLIKGLLGLVRFNHGRATILGHTLPQGLYDVRQQVGYVPEDDCYIAGLTGIEAVTYMAKLSGLTGSEGMRRSHEILDFADLAEERYRPVESYSTGMRQKLKFAAAMVHDPDLLIMDEPTTGLDPSQRIAMLNRIKTLAGQHGKSVLVSTHILHDVQLTCDHVVILANGRVAADENLEVLSRPVRPGWSVTARENIDLFLEKVRNAGWVVETSDQASTNHEKEATSGRRFWLRKEENADLTQVWEIAHSTETLISDLRVAKNSLQETFVKIVRDSAKASQESSQLMSETGPADVFNGAFDANS